MEGMWRVFGLIGACTIIAHRRSIAPALLRQASYGTLKIGLYHHLKKMNPGGE